MAADISATLLEKKNQKHVTKTWADLQKEIKKKKKNREREREDS